MHNKLIKPCLLAVLFLPLVVTAQSDDPDKPNQADESEQNKRLEEENAYFKALHESLEATKIDPALKTPWWKGGGIWTPLPPGYGRTDG